MRQWRKTLLLVAVLLAGVVAAGFGLLRTYGLVADRPPGAIETAIARRLVILSVPASARRLSNPLAADEQAWRAAADHFAEHCAMCHGEDGRGQTPIGPRMYPPVPDLTDSAIQQMSDGTLFAVIQNGVRWTGMPAFRGEHTPEATWQLVSFIRHLPRLEPEELKRRGESVHQPGEPAHTHGAADHAGPLVTIEGTAFAPDELKVKVGDTVVWRNQDPFPHNVYSSAAAIRSADLEPEQQWRWRATRVGRFPYVCTLHPGMKGIIVVGK